MRPDTERADGVRILACVRLIATVTVDQGRGALAALLLFAFVMVAVLTAVAVLLLSLHRRRTRREAGRASAGSPPLDAWREAGRRAVPPDHEEE